MVVADEKNMIMWEEEIMIVFVYAYSVYEREVFAKW
jgi:hypothetical protein